MITESNQRHSESRIIDLDAIIESYSRAFQVRNPNELVILPDTCSIKRIPLSENGTPLFTLNRDYDIKLTRRIFNEMQRSPYISLPVFSLVYLIASDIIHPEISNENLRFIQEANFRAKGKERIGIADAQMISYAIDRARKEKQTVIMSDDGHILKTISYLRKKSGEKEKFHKNLFAFGIQRIIENFPEHKNNSDLNLETSAA